jgi:hypothetical protein
MVPIAVTIECSGQYGFTARPIMYPVALGEFSGHSAAITNFSTLTGVSGAFEVVLRVAIWGSGLRGAALARYHEAKRPDNLARIGRQNVAETPPVLAVTLAGQSDTPSAAGQWPHHHLTTRQGSPSDDHYRQAEPRQGSEIDIAPRITNPGVVTSSTESPASSKDNQ